MTRYSRQERFKPIGEQGQHKIGAAHVLIVGAGASVQLRLRPLYAPASAR
ncbi:hypothetical protein [Geomicrobium sp. JCM 19037]|nr:hypothetical protein [Geomicrobium sp. JCM 19037]